MFSTLSYTHQRELKKSDKMAMVLLRRWKSLPAENLEILIITEYDAEKADKFVERLKGTQHSDLADFQLYAKFLRYRFEIPLREINRTMHPFCFKDNETTKGVTFNCFCGCEIANESPFFAAHRMRCLQSDSIRGLLMGSVISPIDLTGTMAVEAIAPERLARPDGYILRMAANTQPRHLQYPGDSTDEE